MNPRPLTRVSLAACAVAPFALIAGDAHASGISVARFGGAHGNVTEGNPSAVYYNPGALGFTSGTHLTIDVAWALRNASYERPESAIDGISEVACAGDEECLANLRSAHSGTNELHNLLYAPFAGVSSDLFLDSPFRLGFAFFVPFGGSASWDRTDPVDGIPDAIYGVNRFWSIDGTIRTLGLSLAGAYMIDAARLSLGVAGNFYKSEVETVRTRNFDGTDNPFNTTAGQTYVSAESTNFGLGVGLLWEAVEEELWLGASWQSAPDFSGELTLEGDLRYEYPGTVLDLESDVYVTQQLPDVFRLGARYQATEQLEVRLFGDFTRWSAFEEQCILVSEQDGRPSDVDRDCATEPDGRGSEGVVNPPVAVLRRDWEDAWGVRGGGSYLFSDRLELSLGAGYDSNAIPDDTLEPAMLDFPKAGFDIGVRLLPIDWAIVSLGATYIAYFERDISDEESYQQWSPPSRQPSAAGVYNQNILVGQLNLEFLFGDAGGL